jgi:hypothetical protein
VITRKHVEALLRSPVPDPMLVVVAGRVMIAAAAELDADPYRGAMEIISREDLVTQLGSDVPPEHHLDEVAARLDAMVTQLGA